MSPAEVAALAARLDALHDDIGEIKDDVCEVKDLAKATNGRVRKLELWKAELQGASKLGTGIAGYIAPVITGVITALILVAILGNVP